jgi:iron(III) transport system permease protein
MDDAGRSLGLSPPGMSSRRIHLPLIRPAVLTAMILVFVDVLKELPATLILQAVQLQHAGGAHLRAGIR